MVDAERLSIHQVTLLQQCTTPQFVAALVRNSVPCTSLWREKTLEHGVEATGRLIADNGIALSGYCFGGLITSPDRDEAARARDDVRRALDEAAAIGAPCLVFVAGGVDERDRNIAAARERALEGIAKLIPHARSVGVKLALEPLHPMICATRSVLTTIKLANEWCDRLGAWQQRQTGRPQCRSRHGAWRARWQFQWLPRLKNKFRLRGTKKPQCWGQKSEPARRSWPRR